MLSIHHHYHHHESFPNLIDFHPVPFLMIKVSELPVALAVLAVVLAVVIVVAAAAVVLAVVVAAAVVAAIVVVAAAAAVAVTVDILKISFRNQKIILI